LRFMALKLHKSRTSSNYTSTKRAVIRQHQVLNPTAPPKQGQRSASRPCCPPCCLSNPSGEAIAARIILTLPSPHTAGVHERQPHAHNIFLPPSRKGARLSQRELTELPRCHIIPRPTATTSAPNLTPRSASRPCCPPCCLSNPSGAA